MKLTQTQRFAGLTLFGFLIGISHLFLPAGVWVGLIIVVLVVIYGVHYGI
jgi:hypothetical protein